MTNTLVERLEAALAKATPLPWVYRPDRFDDWGFIRGPEKDSDIGRYRPIVALGKDSDVPHSAFDEHRQNKTDPYAPNAMLIVEAVNALPEIIAILKARSQTQEGENGE